MKKDAKDGIAVLVAIAVVFIFAYGLGLMSNTVDIHYGTAWMWAIGILCIAATVISVLLLRAHGSRGGMVVIYTFGVIMGTVALSFTLPVIINYHTAVSFGDAPMEKVRVVDLSMSQVTVSSRHARSRHAPQYEYMVKVVNSRGDTLQRHVTEKEYRNLCPGDIVLASEPRGWFGWRVLKMDN